jgi:hypothetical protein
MFRAV